MEGEMASVLTGDACTKQHRIERLIQRGDQLALDQQERQSERQYTPRTSDSTKTSISTAVSKVFTPRRSSWTPQEDEKLRKLVQQLGRSSWREIAAHFPSRDRKRCRERFVNHLALSLRATAWTAQEDEKLLQLQRRMKSQWTKIAQQFHGKSPENVKNRCLLLARRADRGPKDKKRALPQRWTTTEKQKLAALVAIHGARNWLFIASQLPGRTDLQCLQQWYRTLDETVVKGKGTWTVEEDQVLVQKVAEVGRKWTEVAAFLPGRMGNQCRERYLNHLNPSISTTPWTAAEEKILTESIEKHSTQWGLVAAELPGRSENSIKNHWYARERHRMLATASASTLPPTE